MTEPIDILALATARLAAAQLALEATRAMQHGPTATAAYEAMCLEYALARADLLAVRGLAIQLSSPLFRPV